jgi:flagellar basal-body rod modification protein FlgD
MNLHGISTITPVAHMFTNLSANANAASSAGAASSSSSPNSSNPATNAADQAQSTFISLLVTELQSQDPTQPMDPTAMVGQMFSMNQLEQLISINQTLTNAFAPLTGGSSAGSTQGALATGGAGSSPNQVLTGGN